MTDIAFRSATALAREVRLGRIGAYELLGYFLKRVERYNPALNAIIATDLDGAKKRARAADRARSRGQSLGPLHGLPMTVKESFDMVGLPTTWGLAEHRDHRATNNAAAVQRLIDAGAIVFGKTNVPVLLAEWQSFNPIYGTTNNPWDLTRVPGGSSGGASAALAAGLTTLEMGSDIGGSIRNPAHFTGVYGHKPSFELVPTVGHALPGMFAPLDMLVAGPLARSAPDLELAMRVLVGPDAVLGHRRVLPRTKKRALREFRVGVITTTAIAPVAAEVQEAIRTLARFIAGTKARVSDTARPAFSMDEYFTTYVHLLRSATSGGHSDPAGFRRMITQAEALAPDDHTYFAEMLRGNTLRHRDWVSANNRRYQMLGAWLDYFKSYDVLIAPIAPTAAFAHNHVGERHERTIDVDGSKQTVANMLFWAGYAGAFYLPSTAIPIGKSKEGLPIGAQIIGPPGGDLTCIALAKLLERDYRGFEAPPGWEDGAY